MQRTLDAVLCFDIDNEEIVRRLSSRLVCGTCQTPYTAGEHQAGDKCPKCGGTLGRRRDDDPAAIRNRLSVYEAQTAPVFDWYRKQGTKLVVVNAVGAVAEVTSRALKALGR